MRKFLPHGQSMFAPSHQIQLKNKSYILAFIEVKPLALFQFQDKCYETVNLFEKYSIFIISRICVISLKGKQNERKN